MYKKPTILLFVMAVILSTGLAQYTEGYYQFPMKAGQRNYLSATMGELRANHFHSGIDIKTGGVEGWEIHSAADGYVSRIKVSPYGYGLAIYILHPNGQTTVYAHCSKFRYDIDAYILAEQYKSKTFAIELFPQANQFPVKKGELIAYSGNSGGSMGPHLHFEIRDNQQRPLNPLRFGFKEIIDNTKPYFYHLAINTHSEDARVNNQFGSIDFKPTEVSRGNYKISKPIKVHGELGIIVHTNDKLDGAANRDGVAGLIVTLDGKTTFKYQNDRFPFSKTRYINVHMDYDRYINGKGKMHKCFIDMGNKLDLYERSIGNGKIIIRDTLKHQLIITSIDSYGNKSTLSAILIGSPPLEIIKTKPRLSSQLYLKHKIFGDFMRIRTNSTHSSLLASLYVKQTGISLTPVYGTQKFTDFIWNLNNGLPDSIQFGKFKENFHFARTIPSNVSYTLYHKNALIYFPKNALYHPLHLELSSKDSLFKIGTYDSPLHKNISISLKPDKVPQDKSRYHAYYIDEDGDLAFEGGNWEDNALKFKTRTLGNYVIAKDVEQPSIKLLKRNGKKISFVIEDKLSGIDSYNAYLNGNWVLLTYRYQSGVVTTRFKNQQVLSGELKIVVTDNAGNKNTYKLNL